MAHREEFSVVNYGQRGPRGKTGRGVSKIEMDSEGYLTAYYTDQTSEGIGHIPSGPQGEPGQNGKIVDVIVNGESVVTSEGIAYITASSEGQTYVAGDNIEINGNVISAIDTKYTAGDNIEISASNIISAQVDDVIDEDILVTVNVGNYYAGDVIHAGEKLKDVVKNLLYKETPPVPPVQDTWYWWASNDVPTEIPASASSKAIDAQAVARDGMIQYFTTSRQYATVAYPASMGNLTHIIESDFMDVLDLWTRVETIKDGVPYLIYYNVKTKSTDIKEEFKWR